MKNGILFVIIALIISIGSLVHLSIASYYITKKLTYEQESLKSAKTEVVRLEEVLKVTGDQRNKLATRYTNCRRQVTRIKSLASRPIEAAIERLGNISEELADIRMKMLENPE